MQARICVSDGHSRHWSSRPSAALNLPMIKGTHLRTFINIAVQTKGSSSHSSGVTQWRNSSFLTGKWQKASSRSNRSWSRRRRDALGDPYHLLVVFTCAGSCNIWSTSATRGRTILLSALALAFPKLLITLRGYSPTRPWWGLPSWSWNHLGLPGQALSPSACQGWELQSLACF